MAFELKDNENDPELPPEDMFKLCFILLNICGGKAIVPRATLDALPAEAKVTHKYDEDKDAWIFRAPIPKSKRKRGILRPKRKLILPP